MIDGVLRDCGAPAGIFYYEFAAGRAAPPKLMREAGGRAVASIDEFRPWCAEHGVDLVRLSESRSPLGDWCSYAVVPATPEAAFALKLRWL